MVVTRLCIQMANCKVGDVAKVVSGRPDYIGLKVRCVREVTQEELVASGIPTVSAAGPWMSRKAVEHGQTPSA